MILCMHMYVPIFIYIKLYHNNHSISFDSSKFGEYKIIKLNYICMHASDDYDKTIVLQEINLLFI